VCVYVYACVYLWRAIGLARLSWAVKWPAKGDGGGEELFGVGGEDA
jgi:hypothetical protein